MAWPTRRTPLAGANPSPTGRGRQVAQARPAPASPEVMGPPSRRSMRSRMSGTDSRQDPSYLHRRVVTTQSEASSQRGDAGTASRGRGERSGG
jgi:hypothetical protein